MTLSATCRSHDEEPSTPTSAFAGQPAGGFSFPVTPSSEPPEAIADTVFGTWPSFKERCKVSIRACLSWRPVRARNDFVRLPVAPEGVVVVVPRLRRGSREGRAWALYHAARTIVQMQVTSKGAAVQGQGGGEEGLSSGYTSGEDPCDAPSSRERSPAAAPFEHLAFRPGECLTCSAPVAAIWQLQTCCW